MYWLQPDFTYLSFERSTMNSKAFPNHYRDKSQLSDFARNSNILHCTEEILLPTT
ncbi:hypothetical protein D1BOALGB6SA_2867 [Olavius sp. associated proteobacterium Delta 1]|nr:hypothetical protein D1BOALGB6SA_2867 [Olavius sp. associated proteobacterium Delta 1]